MTNMRRARSAMPIMVMVLVIVLMLTLMPPLALRNGAYQLFRIGAWSKVAWERHGLSVISGSRANVYFSGEDRHSATLVSQLLDQFAPQVDRDYGLTGQSPLQVVIYGSRSALATSMGWSSGDSALGVYWGNSIKLLSPLTWLGQQQSAELIDETYARTGPIAHEYTHYVIDQLTSSNIPRWLNEGLAQVEEEKLTGYRWLESGSRLTTANLYSLAEMEQGFDQLPNQARVYHQCYTLARFLVDQEGQEKVNLMLRKLGEGFTLDQAMRQVMGYGVQDYQRAWRAWLVSEYGITAQ